jgi:hypothetical protein
VGDEKSRRLIDPPALRQKMQLVSVGEELSQYNPPPQIAAAFPEIVQLN